MRGLWIKGRDGRITVWACTDAHQGVYMRDIADFRWVERLPPAGTPVFRSRWHFLRFVKRRFGVLGRVVSDNYTPGHHGVVGPEPEGVDHGVTGRKVKEENGG